MNKHVGKEMELNIEGQTYQVKINELSDDKARVTVDGREMEVLIKRSQPDQPAAAAPQPVQTAAPAPKKAAPAPPSAGKDALAALMPGVVVRILVGEGQDVAAGEVLLVLEAMKMENEIRCDRAGKIAKVHVAVGQQVQTGDPLVSF